MLVTQKCQYALRAIFALARQEEPRPVKIAQVAEEQAIPVRFLEVILGQLKQAGFVDSRRGMDGGYWLARRPAEITVGEIVAAIDGPIHLEPAEAEEKGIPRPDAELFRQVWKQAGGALEDVLRGISMADLLERQRALQARYVPDYTI